MDKSFKLNCGIVSGEEACHVKREDRTIPVTCVLNQLYEGR